MLQELKEELLYGKNVIHFSKENTLDLPAAHFGAAPDHDPSS